MTCKNYRSVDKITIYKITEIISNVSDLGLGEGTEKKTKYRN